MLKQVIKATCENGTSSWQLVDSQAPLSCNKILIAVLVFECLFKALWADSYEMQACFGAVLLANIKCLQ